MTNENNDSPEKKLHHTFHIPVMGTGFTLDTPLRVAKYGISSVISLVDDVLIEQMRKVLCKKYNEEYNEISDNDEDPRANRIAAYLNMIHKLVKEQVAELQKSAFDSHSPLTRYFRMLPHSSTARKLYEKMIACTDAGEKETMQDDLRKMAVPGDVDVNIMTKLDTATYKSGEKLSEEHNSAMAALRGFAKSNLESAIVFSAGLNQRLYSYCARFRDFFLDENGRIKKKIILKVSDYRSALVQGKFFAKRGLWISEFRIESGINCGGHTFPGKGNLLGPVLDEFRKKKDHLADTLHKLYAKAIQAIDGSEDNSPRDVKITVQGGIGTAEEDRLLLDYYHMDGTGWATPFMLTPEVVEMDKEHLEKLLSAGEKDIFLSNSSPVGVPFWNLYSSASENARRRRIESGKPGSLCRKRFLTFNSEFTEQPLCVASAAYQKKKLAQLDNSDINNEKRIELRKEVLAKSCICHDLGGSLVRHHHIDSDAQPAICCGPNIINFSKTTTLDEMVDHIYGRADHMTNPDRKHMFVKELEIYIHHYKSEIDKFRKDISENAPEYFKEFRNNLLEGIEYYSKTAREYILSGADAFLNDIEELKCRLEEISLHGIVADCVQA